MRILIIENAAERQGYYVNLIDSFGKAEQDKLELEISLCVPGEAPQLVSQMDVAIIGSGLEDKVVELTQSLMKVNSSIFVLGFVNPEFYLEGSFRNFYSAGVKKVFADNCSPIDVQQELVSIHMEFCRSGKVKEGQVICVVQAKGGSGATTICAGLGDLFSSRQHNTLLWDLDVESSDLCRAYAMNSSSSREVSKWTSGRSKLTSASFRKAVFSLNPELHFLGPPESDLADVMDLICHADSIPLCNRILEFAKSTHDITIIDTAGKLGPAVASLISNADYVIVVIEDSLIGLTGLNYYLKLIKPLITNMNKMCFLLNGDGNTYESIADIKNSLSNLQELDELVWRLPPVPFDRNALSWAGTQKTIYSLGGAGTKKALEGVAEQLLSNQSEEKASALAA